MKILRVTKRLAHMLHMLKANHMYDAIADVLDQLIAGDAELIAEATELYNRTTDTGRETTIMASTETAEILLHIQQQHRARYNKVISFGKIAEALCTKNIVAAYYRELMNKQTIGE